MGGNDGNDEGGNDGNNGLVCGLKLDWKCCPPWCHGFHPVVLREMTGKRWKRREQTTEMTRGEMTETTGKPRTGLWLKIRLEMLSCVVSWFPPRGVMGNDREMTETMGGNDGEMTETMGDT